MEALSFPLLHPLAGFQFFKEILLCILTYSYCPLMVIRIRIGASPFFSSFVFRTKNRMFIVPCFMIIFFLKLYIRLFRQT